jgi:hypothetical protein
MSLEDRAREARQIADTSTDWRDHRVALALEAALHAERQKPYQTADTTGIEPWSKVSTAN